jgi:hypothetical protein
MTQDGAEESRPMTRFQKVASALRGDKPDDELENDSDYWDDESSAANEDRPVAVTRPDGLVAEAPEEDAAQRPDMADVQRPDMADVHRPDMADVHRPDVTDVERPDGAGTAVADDQTATQPDVFGTSARPDPGEAPVPAGAVTPQVAPETVPPVTPEAVTPESVTPEAVTPEGVTPQAGSPMAADVPGDFSDIVYGNLIPEATQFREQWQQIQFKFVDDPRGSVTEAADVVAQVTARLEAAIQERQRVITEHQRSLRSRWDRGSNGGSADTEALRGTLRMYRAFLDQLLGSR